MNRADLQQLTEDRIFDAQALLAAGRWSGAYYLAGYAVECGLKSCVLVRIANTGVIFEDRRFSERCWTHDLGELVIIADLQVVRGLAVAANLALKQNWDIVLLWSEVSRYQQKTQAQAEELYNALADSTNGVLQWMRAHW